MSDDTFQVRPAWPDAMIYAEGEARQIRLACLSPEEPPVVEVPAEARWREQMPAWAHERRALIVARLRSAKCVLCEVDGQLACTDSPDGTLRLECESTQDERTGLWESARVIDLRDGDVLASVVSYGASCAARFPAARSIVLTFNDRASGRRVLTIDADRKLYSVDASPPSRPLSELPRVLAYQAAPSPVFSPQLPRPAGSSWLLALGSIVLTAAGIRQLTSGVTIKDRVLGGLCAVFFGVSSWLSLQERWRR